MAEKKGVTIVIKKVQAGHGGAHGGAWKVAFADFMTAMMAFFLVMWLMGSDEETKQAVSHYFNHPNTPYSAGRDPQSETTHPLGEKNGSGDSIVKGAKGAVPDEMVPHPAREAKEEVEDKLSDVAFGVELDADIDVLKFNILGDEIFEEGTAKIRPEIKPRLGQIASLLKKYSGYIQIRGHLDARRSPASGDPYLFSTERAVAIMNYFIKEFKMDENRFCPSGGGSRNPWSVNGEDTNHNRRVEFTLSQKNPCSS